MYSRALCRPTAQHQSPHLATVVTAITVAAIKGQDGYSLSKIASNKHLPENLTNPKEQQRAFECPKPTYVNNYVQLKSSKLSQRLISHSSKAY